MLNESGQWSDNAIERRQRHGLRAVFKNAYEIVAPFLHPESGWAGHTLTHLAYRVLRENFADLSSEEVHSLVVSAYRAYIDQYPADSEHLPRPAELRQPVLGGRGVAC